MEFIRQVINSNDLESILALPPSFSNLQVEVIVLPIDSSKNNVTDVSKTVKHSAYGRLKAYANPSLISEEGGAWEKEAAEKYDLR